MAQLTFFFVFFQCQFILLIFYLSFFCLVKKLCKKPKMTFSAVLFCPQLRKIFSLQSERSEYTRIYSHIGRWNFQLGFIPQENDSTQSCKLLVGIGLFLNFICTFQVILFLLLHSHPKIPPDTCLRSRLRYFTRLDFLKTGSETLKAWVKHTTLAVTCSDGNGNIYTNFIPVDISVSLNNLSNPLITHI